jgi:hypothetical protein
MKLAASQLNALLTKKLASGLAIDTGSVSALSIAAGAIVGADNGLDAIETTAQLNIALTTSGKNGLDTGAEAANSWYFIWLIKNPVTGEVAGLLSLSATAPTLPSGFTLKRLVGAARNDGSSNLVPFHQVGASVHYPTPQLIINTAATPTTMTALDLSALVPDGLSRRVQVNGNLNDASNGQNASLHVGHYDLLGQTAANGVGINLCRILAEEGSAVGKCAGSAEVLTDASGRFTYGTIAANQTINLYVASFLLEL